MSSNIIEHFFSLLSCRFFVVVGRPSKWVSIKSAKSKADQNTAKLIFSVYASSKWCFFLLLESAILIKSQKLYQIFNPILAVLWSGWFGFFLRSPVAPVSFPGSWGLFLRLVSPSASCSTLFLVLWQDLSICPAFHFPLLSIYSLLKRQNLLNESFFSY